MKAIPEKWIRNYIDQLLDVAKGLPENSLMREAILLRADHTMDMVKAWQEAEQQNADHTDRQADTGHEGKRS